MTKRTRARRERPRSTRTKQELPPIYDIGAAAWEALIELSAAAARRGSDSQWDFLVLARQALVESIDRIDAYMDAGA